MSNKNPKELLCQIKSILAESKRHPLEDHPYHSKSDDQLKFIIKDASEAAKAMRTHGTPQGDAAESKYLDQVNDASTVLHFRKQHGTPDWYKEKYLKKKINENHIQEVSKELLQRYKELSDFDAKRLDREAKEGKDPVENIKKITKASKRGLGAFKAHLKIRKMENK